MGSKFNHSLRGGKGAVLTVSAAPMMSQLSLMAGGMARLCMGVGWTKPRSYSAETTGGGVSSSSHSCIPEIPEEIPVSLVTVSELLVVEDTLAIVLSIFGTFLKSFLIASFDDDLSLDKDDFFIFLKDLRLVIFFKAGCWRMGEEGWVREDG